MPQTSYMILRKTGYGETSLIVSGFSPDFGRIDFMLRGARQSGKKKFPFACLFRELTVDFREPGNAGTLASLCNQESLCIHDDLASHTECYMEACQYAAFLLQNTRYQVPVPRAYAALSHMLSYSAETGTPYPWLPYAKLVFLHENGFVSVPPDKEKILQAVFDFAEGKTAVPPPFSVRYLTLFTAWIHALAERCSS